MMNTHTNERMMDLKTTHEQLDSELRRLNRRGHLTPTEQQRARVIKKEKLRAKDRIRVLAQHAQFTS